ncbi:MAG TPA: HAD-IIIA family hydrolase [Bacteroidia bacterium]|jgi:3-deoxy-D-manno-octulosonate 8-phosphate phosphatase (KDO 8-P phosphatase)|nr:HAD-IIIA family hydrolase [Bacteroidia bacterium]
MNYLSSNIKFLKHQRKQTVAGHAQLSVVKEKHIKQAEKNSNNVTLPQLISFSQAFGLSIDALVNVDLATKYTIAKNIKLLVIDIDGVLTDGGMYYTENGDELKKFNTKDGLAIKRLVKNGMQVAFLSNGKNTALIQSRAKLLGVQKIYVGFEEKEKILDKWVKDLKISYKNVAYVGDDVNDLKVITKAGFSACPADAMDAIKQKATIILTRNGGDACVREMIDNYL